jgi:hypothetical protein
LFPPMERSVAMPMKVDAKREVVEEMFHKSPMIALSPTSHMQFKGLQTLGQEIESLLGGMWDGPSAMNEKGMLAVLRFWLWVLGSYELTRAARARTTALGLQNLADRFREFERFIKPLRIVMAKQEFAGKAGSDAWREAMSSGLTKDGRDFLYEVQGNTFTMRGCIAEFERILGAITFEDVKALIEKQWRLDNA